MFANFKYIKGVAEPSRAKLSLIADALNVNESWLLGYDAENGSSVVSLEQYKSLLYKDKNLTDDEIKYIFDYLREKHGK